MSADRLREAARVLRERAEAAPGGPWRYAEHGDYHTGPTEVRVMSSVRPELMLVGEYDSYSGLAAGYAATMHPGVALALADWLAVESADDGHLPHKYPKEAPDEVVSWTCQACGVLVREMCGPTTTCTVDWRPRSPYALRVADLILGAES